MDAEHPPGHEGVLCSSEACLWPGSKLHLSGKSMVLTGGYLEALCKSGRWSICARPQAVAALLPPQLLFGGGMGRGYSETGPSFAIGRFWPKIMSRGFWAFIPPPTPKTAEALPTVSPHGDHQTPTWGPLPPRAQ